MYTLTSCLSSSKLVPTNVLALENREKKFRHSDEHMDSTWGRVFCDLISFYNPKTGAW